MEFFIIKGSTDISKHHLLQFDGGSVPNPGACGSGAVIYSPTGVCLWEVGEYIPYGTNNIAEYRGLEIGLSLALRIGLRSIKIEGDSNLVIQQISEKWKVRNAGLLDPFRRVKELLSKFDAVACRHIYREQNTHADRLTNELQVIRSSFERNISQ